MELTLLVQSIGGLIVILTILTILLLMSPKKKTKKKKIEPVVKKNNSIQTDLASLKAIIKNKKTTKKELKSTLDLVLKHHGNIHKKLGSRSHPDFDTYMEILMIICKHPNTTKDIIIEFDKALVRKNPDYKSDINDAITKGLNSRGI